MTLPALHALREAYPEAKISWLVRKEYAGLINGHKDLDELVIFDRKLFAKFYSFTAIRAIVAFLKKLKRAKYDLVIDFQGLLRSGLFTWFTRAPKRVGRLDAREGATLFYTDKIGESEDNIHVIDHYLHIVEVITGQKSEFSFSLGSDAQALKEVSDALLQEKINVDNYAVLIPAASVDSKCWPSKNYSKLADFLATKYSMDTVLVGSSQERASLDVVCENAEARVVNLAGKTSLAQLVELLKKAKIVISNDTGPGQIAQASGAKTLLIFGYTNPKRFGVYGKPERNICVDYDKRSSRVRDFDSSYSIEHISVDAVKSQIEKTLKL